MRPAGNGSNHHRYGEVKTRLTNGSRAVFRGGWIWMGRTMAARGLRLRDDPHAIGLDRPGAFNLPPQPHLAEKDVAVRLAANFQTTAFDQGVDASSEKNVVDRNERIVR
jgi:hypothetical protein